MSSPYRNAATDGADVGVIYGTLLIADVPVIPDPPPAPPAPPPVPPSPGIYVPSITVTDPHGRGTFTIPYYSNAVRIQGCLFPEGTSTLLFFGHLGEGAFHYGLSQPDGTIYDPTFPSGQGEHAYPYTCFVWAFDVHDLAAVKAGSKLPWNVQPYTGWTFTSYGDTLGISGMGAAWDPDTRRVYLTVSGTGPNVTPLVHVFEVA